MWHDPGTWIALGISVLFVVAGVVLHLVFIRILKHGAEPAAEQPPFHQAQNHE